MRRITATTSLTAALAIAAAPVGAQDFDAFVWDPVRPDAQAPASVVGDRLVPQGALTVTYRLMHAEMGGLRFEGENEGFQEPRQPELTPEELIQFFSVVPLTRSRQIHEAELLYGASERVTLLIRVPYIFNDADQLTSIVADGEDSFTTFETSSDGFGDPSATALIGFWNSESFRSHFMAGFSFPVADFTAVDVSPLPAPTEAVLPFPMQLGSGTWEFLPGFTLRAMNDVGTVGAQALATIRLGENNQGWNLGNQLTTQIWLAPRISDYLSISLGIVSNWWENVRLAELDLTDPLDPRLFDVSAVPFFQGGNRWDVPVGLNVYFPERSVLHGLRLSGEAIFPAHHDVDGIQLGLDWGAAFSASWDFGVLIGQ